jgi:hypothetical protein
VNRSPTLYLYIMSISSAMPSQPITQLEGLQAVLGYEPYPPPFMTAETRTHRTLVLSLAEEVRRDQDRRDADDRSVMTVDEVNRCLELNKRVVDYHRRHDAKDILAVKDLVRRVDEWHGRQKNEFCWASGRITFV